MEYAIFAGLALYLVPSFVAAGRDHYRAEIVIALNLALGWTVIGWVALLAWALRSPATPPRRPRPHPHLRVVDGGRSGIGRAA